MFPGPRPPYQGGMPPQPFHHPMQGRYAPRQQMGPMMRPPMQNSRGGGGGILSKILGQGKQGGGPTGARAAGLLGNSATSASRAGGGILQSLTNPASINGFLANTQKVLNTANQFGPMVQQYGPMVKNIPAMWKLYRGLKDVPEEKATNEKSKKSDSSNASVKINPAKEEKPQKTVSVQKESKGQSKPKLYI